MPLKLIIIYYNLYFIYTTIIQGLIILYLYIHFNTTKTTGFFFFGVNIIKKIHLVNEVAVTKDSFSSINKHLNRNRIFVINANN